MNKLLVASRLTLSASLQKGKAFVITSSLSLQRQDGGDLYLKKMKRISYVLAAVLGSILVFLHVIHAKGPQEESFFDFYSNFFFQESLNWVAFIIAVVYLASPVVSSIRWIRKWFGRNMDDELPFRKYIQNRAILVAKYASHFLQMVFPIILNLVILSSLVGYLNVENRNRLIGPNLASIGHVLTGTYPFLSLEMVKFPAWLIKSIELSFLNLPLILLFAAGFTYFKRRVIFSKYVVSLLLSIALMLPIWLAVPAMSPQDRFINNVYHLHNPARIESAVRSFKPVPSVAAFLTFMRRAKAGLEVMPTTTFPSSHAAWAVIAFVYLLEAEPITALLFSPFLLLSTFGTFYLSQHYLIDVPAGIAMGLVSVAISSLLFHNAGLKVSADTSTVQHDVVPDMGQSHINRRQVIYTNRPKHCEN
jgi:PAP2 superfamily